MDQSSSLLKKRIKFPSREETAFVIKKLSNNEKIAFLAFFIVFVASAVFLLWQANNAISVTMPDDGGTITEGIIGTPRFLNPLLAISDVDKDIVSLVYSGLLRPDNQGALMLDLAEKYEISDDGLEYTFTLKPDLEWPDGKPITSEDIVFTIQQAKDPILKSPRKINWEGVETEKIDDRAVKFILQKPYAPFLENLAIGIIPKHLWGEASSDLMSFSEYNIKPVGSGPFQLKTVAYGSSGIISSFTLVPNGKFVLGKPHIKKLILNFYPSESKLTEAYKKGEISSVGALSPQTAEEIKRTESRIKSYPLPRTFAVFFNQNSAKVFTQQETREALNLATDKQKIVKAVLDGFGQCLDSPLPPGATGALTGQSQDFDLEKAKQIFEKNGWEQNKDGVLEKKVKKETFALSFSISTSDMPELKKAALLLKEMWEKLGARIEIKIFEIGDLNQNIIRARKYDALLFGEVLGRDPDAFVFWHSSQRNDPGLNVALYANSNADKILESARAETDGEKKKNLYEKFQQEILKDKPAVFLYSPDYVYIVPNGLKGIEEEKYITNPSERFSQAYKWYIKTSKVWKIFAK